jgi:hypothetical protein
MLDASRLGRVELAARFSIGGLLRDRACSADIVARGG